MYRLKFGLMLCVVVTFIVLGLPLVYALPKVYLNNNSLFSSSGNFSLQLLSNLTSNDNINHSFEGRSSSSNAFWDVEYVASNTTGFLLRLRIEDNTGLSNDNIKKVDCVDTSDSALSLVCDNGCGTNGFSNFHDFSIIFFPNFTSDLFLDGVRQLQGINVCTNATKIDMLRFSRRQGLTYEVKNNLILANNIPPTFTGILPNIKWPEDTSTYFNISGNFSEPNNDTLTYSLLSSVENITININSTTGIINLTPSPDFFGVRYVTFLANDSDNVTFSNNVTLNVTNVNDIPAVSNVMLNNTDLLNRTNGSLIVSWQFSDPDNDSPAGNETLWYVNGTQITGFRNLKSINSSNLSKNQNWTVSVRVFDGINFSMFVNSTPLIIQNSAPAHAIPLINSNDEQNRKNSTLACKNQSTSDLDNDAIINFIKWYKNNVVVNTAIDSANLNAGNFSKNDNITCEITPYDGAINGTPLNSTIFTILNAAPLLSIPIQNKTWEQDTSSAINLSNSFADIDADALAYNYTPVSNIFISINNNTGVAALTPSSGFSGIMNILFFAFDGANLTSSNNVTLTISSAPAPSSPSSSSSSTSSGDSGGGNSSGNGNGFFVCNMDWKCEEWSPCANGLKTRKCDFVKVQQHAQDAECPSSSNKPLSDEKCEAGDAQSQASNPEPAPDNNKKVEKKDMTTPSITGHAITNIPRAGNIYLALAVLLSISSILFYVKFSHRRMF